MASIKIFCQTRGNCSTWNFPPPQGGKQFFSLSLRTYLCSAFSLPSFYFNALLGY